MGTTDANGIYTPSPGEDNYHTAGVNADLAALSGHIGDSTFKHIRVTEPPPMQHVSTTGNDANDGRWDRPKLTVQAAINALPTSVGGARTYKCGIVQIGYGKFNTPLGLVVRYGEDYGFDSGTVPTGLTGVTIRGSGKTGTIIYGNNYNVPLLLVDGSSGSAAPGFRMENLCLMGGGGVDEPGPNGHAFMGGLENNTLLGPGAGASFRDVRFLQMGLYARAFYVPTRSDFNDVLFEGCEFAVRNNNTADSACKLAGWGSINDVTFLRCRFHTHLSPSAKGFILTTPDDNNHTGDRNYNVELQNCNFEQTIAGAIHLIGAGNTVLDNIQMWDATADALGPMVLLDAVAGNGNNGRTANTTIRNYWSARTAAHRASQPDIKLMGGNKVINTRIEQSMEMKTITDSPSVPGALTLDLGNTTGVVLDGIPSNTIIQNDSSPYVYTDDIGIVHTDKLRMKYIGGSVPVGGVDGEQRLGKNKVWLRSNGVWGYAPTTVWAYTAFTKDDISGLVAWYNADQISGADGDPVASWTDTSDTAVPATQATAGKRPLLKKAANGLNSHNVVLFDGTDDWLQFADPLLGLTSATVFVVANRTASTTTRRMLEFQNATNTALYLNSNIAGTDSIRWNYGNGAGVQQFYHSTPGTGYHIIGGRVANADFGSLYIDGVAALPKITSPTAAAIVPAATAYIGCSLGSNSFFDASIAEILIFNWALDMNSVNGVHAYLGDKYGIAVGAL